jgi:hypothetical protein
VSIVDVAGVAVGLQASDDARRAALVGALAGFPDGSAPTVASITLDSASEGVPDESPQAEERGFRFWIRTDGVVVSTRSAVLRVAGD